MVTLAERRDYWSALNNIRLTLTDIDGILTLTEGQAVTQAELEAIPDADLIPYLKSIKKQEMRDIGAGIFKSIVSPYSPEERETWHRQVSEAEAYLVDPLSSTPLLDALVLARGNTKEDQATRIVTNKLAFENMAGSILGNQQKKIDLIDAAMTVAEVESITWE